MSDDELSNSTERVLIDRLTTSDGEKAKYILNERLVTRFIENNTKLANRIYSLNWVIAVATVVYAITFVIQVFFKQ